MIKSLPFAITLVFLCGILHAQSPTYSYQINNSLLESNSSAQPLVSSGAPVYQQVNTLGALGVVNAFAFSPTNGLTFTDTAGKIFADSTYSIEMLVKFSDLSNWSKIIDFKNATTDEGCYVYANKLNFYAQAVGLNTIIDTNKLLHLVLTRDQSKRVRMWANANLIYTFSDTAGRALPSTAKAPLKFFTDDVVTNNEATFGHVALINFYDSVLKDSAIAVKRSALVPFPAALDGVSNTKVFVYPNPCSNYLIVDIKQDYEYSIINARGAIVANGLVTLNEPRINTSNFASGVYMLQLLASNGQRRFVQFTVRLL